MKKKLSIFSLVSLLVAGAFSCKDESLYPLPYNDRITGAYLRIYKQTSNVFDLNDLTNSAFEAILEPVDVNGGNDLASIEFFVSHRRGTNLTPEVFVKSIDASIFEPVAEPTYSEYKRATVRVTAQECLTALQTLTTEPDGTGVDTNGDGLPGDECPHCIPFKGLAPFVRATSVIYPGTDANAAPGAFIAGDQINIRYEMVMTDGRRISVANPQSGVNTDFANAATSNSTPNITTGQFYNSPFVVIMTARALVTGSWVGTYSLTQNALWSPNHSVALHASSFPTYMNEVLFLDQTVTLTQPAGGLSTEREFTVDYRGTTTTMRVNLENGTTWIPLLNSGVDCSAEREIYWCMPTTGTFAPGSTVLPAGLPQTTMQNRGSYNVAGDGLTAGNTLTLVVDDDCDEYGRRNGYCTWTRRVHLTLTKL